GADGTVTTPVVPDPGLAERNDELARQIRELIDEGLRMADEVDGIAVEEIEGKRPLAGILDMWGSGEFSLDENGLGLNGEGGVGLKEKLLLGENGEYGSVTGMLGAEGNGNLSLGPTGLNAGIGGFAGASGNYTTPDMGLAPGVDGKVGVTGRAGVGAEAGLNLGYDDGKFQLGGKVGASWGLGGSISPSISIDVPEVAGGIVDAGKAVNNVMPWNW
ncbi:MAG: hypothetical protein ACRDXX_10850, partial [Stackebrandtia sp.]